MKSLLLLLLLLLLVLLLLLLLLGQRYPLLHLLLHLLLQPLLEVARRLLSVWLRATRGNEIIWSQT